MCGGWVGWPAIMKGLRKCAQTRVIIIVVREIPQNYRYILFVLIPPKKKVYNFMTPVETCWEKTWHVTSPLQQFLQLWSCETLGHLGRGWLLGFWTFLRFQNFLPSSKHSSWNWTLWRYTSYWKWRYSITILLTEQILHQLRFIPLFAGFLSWWVRRILLLSSSDMSSRILQNRQKMHQNHQKSVQTLVDGAIFWMIVISGNLVGWNWMKKTYDHLVSGESINYEPIAI